MQIRPDIFARPFQQGIHPHQRWPSLIGCLWSENICRMPLRPVSLTFCSTTKQPSTHLKVIQVIAVGVRSSAAHHARLKLRMLLAHLKQGPLHRSPYRFDRNVIATPTVADELFDLIERIVRLNVQTEQLHIWIAFGKQFAEQV